MEVLNTSEKICLSAVNKQLPYRKNCANRTFYSNDIYLPADLNSFRYGICINFYFQFIFQIEKNIEKIKKTIFNHRFVSICSGNHSVGRHFQSTFFLTKTYHLFK